MNKETQFDPSWQELINAFENGLIQPIKTLVIEYRLYYDDEGNIIQVSDSNWNHPESGKYVVVDKDVHQNWHRYYIRKNLPELKLTKASTELQLKKSDSGYLVIKNNPAIILETGESAENTEYYDRRNN